MLDDATYAKREDAKAKIRAVIATRKVSPAEAVLIVAANLRADQLVEGRYPRTRGYMLADTNRKAWGNMNRKWRGENMANRKCVRRKRVRKDWSLNDAKRIHSGGGYVMGENWNS